MSEFTDEQKMHQFMGIEMNIQTWNLLGKENRDEKDNLCMINFAKSSLYHWKKSPKYEPVNEYVMRDVEATHQLFEKLRQYIK